MTDNDIRLNRTDSFVARLHNDRIRRIIAASSICIRFLRACPNYRRRWGGAVVVLTEL